MARIEDVAIIRLRDRINQQVGGIEWPNLSKTKKKLEQLRKLPWPRHLRRERSVALAGLRNGFPEIFKRSEYAHTVDDNKLRDIILEITGLKASDSIAQAIKSTFNVVKSFIPTGADLSGSDDDASVQDEPAASMAHQNGQSESVRNAGRGSKPVGLVYNINIVLPGTSDLKVLNAIFRSVKENLL